MLCITSLQGYTKPCATITGGIGKFWLFDAADFAFTEGTPGADSNPVGYASVARRTGANAAGGAFFYPVDSIYDTIGLDITQANANGFSSVYTYQLAAQLGGMSQQMTNFFKKIDAASGCCQLGIAIFNNDGKLFIGGERYVNSAEIPPFRWRQDGTVIHTGKTFGEFNGADFSMRASYSRGMYEYTGGIATITALQPV